MNAVLDEIRATGSTALHGAITTPADVYNTLPVVQWKNCVKYSRSEEGGAGVFFLEIDPTSNTDARVVSKTKAPISIAKHKRPEGYVKPPKSSWIPSNLPSPLAPPPTIQQPSSTPNPLTGEVPLPPPPPPAKKEPKLRATQDTNPSTSVTPLPPPIPPPKKEPKPSQSNYKIAIKSSATIVQDVFASEILKSLNISCPNSKVLNYAESEFRQMHAVLKHLSGDIERQKVSKEINRPFIMVMDFVDNAIDLSLPYEKTKEYLLWNGDEGASAQKRLQAIGELICADVVLDNWDRFPVIWANEGNPRNVFLRNDPPFVVAIDNLCSCPKFQFIAEYLEKVKLFLLDATEKDIEEEPPSFIVGKTSIKCSYKRVRDCILQFTTVDIGLAGLKAIRQGVLLAIGKIATQLSHRELSFHKRKLEVHLPDDWGNVWQDGLNAIDLDVLDSIVGLFRDAKNRLEKAKHEELHSHIPFLKIIEPQSNEKIRERNCKKETIKISLFQQGASTTPEEGAQVLEAHLNECEKKGYQLPDIVVFPESWMHTRVSPSKKVDQVLAPFSAVTAKFGVYALLGSFPELSEDRKNHNTTALMGKKGEILRTYRKQRPTHPGECDPGASDQNNVVWTELGNLGILICFDIENEDVLQKTLELNPSIILNPICIPPPHGFGNVGGQEMAYSHWKTAILQISKKFERLAKLHRFTIIRVDKSSFGTSQVISPYKTITVPERGITTFDVWIDRMNAPAQPLPCADTCAQPFPCADTSAQPLPCAGAGAHPPSSADTGASASAAVNADAREEPKKEGATTHSLCADARDEPKKEEPAQSNLCASDAALREEPKNEEDVEKSGNDVNAPFYNEFTANAPEQPRTWELENTGNRYSLGIFNHHSSYVTDATFYDSGKVVSASCDTTIKIFNNYLRRCLGTLEGHKKAVTSIECSSQAMGGAIISSSFDGQIKIWSANKLDCINSYEAPTAFKIRRATDPNVFLTANRDGTIHMLDLRKDKILANATQGVPGEEFHELKLLDNTCVVGSSTGTLRTFDVRVPNEYMFTWKPHSDRVSGLDIIDGILLSGSYDGTLKFSDVQNGKEISSISIFPDLENCAAITGAAFVNRNKLLVTSSDTVMRLVDIPTQKCLHTFHHHNAPIYRLSFDGLRFVTCGLDNIFVVGEFYQNCKLVKLGSILN